MDYEKLGVFYLGKTYDWNKQTHRDEPVLYPSKDLTTHAVIIGMTGSGKTGLAMGLLEEALIDQIPVIAIDPKGDLPNLMLTFPELRASDFRPWIDVQEAARRGQTPDAFAAAQADLWRQGLASWGQGPERIRKLKESAEVTLFTPGSQAGTPINVLRQFAPPPPAIGSDPDLLRERIVNTVNGLLSLLEIEADPITSPEHILLANILESNWAAGTSMDLAGLIAAIQNPPFQRVGVLDLDVFFPAQKRLALALRLNNLLAAPGFEAWMAGDPLDVARLLHTPDGKPRASIFSIAHLNDAERMFFVALLLNEMVGWMRTQTGTGSLRALLYMDEIFGFFPPVANPPAKAPLLTLLKQARAMGLGVVLATQNPVDLDYKGLANTGTWFIGRLQTERDVARVEAGLQGASSGGTLRGEKTSDLLSRLGKRVFLLHNVHEAEPVVFQTRWALSYLRGPVTRRQIKELLSAGRHTSDQPSDTRPKPAVHAAPAKERTRPPDPRGISVFFAPPSGAGHGMTYRPTVMAQLDVPFSHRRYEVDTSRTLRLAGPLEAGAITLDWDHAFDVALNPKTLGRDPVSDATFDVLPPQAAKGTPFKKWQKDLLRWVCHNRPLTLWHHPDLGEVSRPDESQADFLGRLAHLAREDRDAATAQLKREFLEKFERLETKYQNAQTVLEREKAQARAGELDAVMSMGTAVLGAFLGSRRRPTSRLRSASRSASRIRKEKMDVTKAQSVVHSVHGQLEALERQFDEALAQIQYAPYPDRKTLEPISIKAKSTQITVELFALVWLPYRQDVDGSLSPDW